MLRPTARATLGLVTLAIAVSGCVFEEPLGPTAPEACVPTEAYFEDEVWNNFMSTTCFACHNAQGEARETDLVLQSSNQAGYMAANLATVENVAAFERDGVSIILLKPSAQIDHGGGLVINEGGDEYQALEGLIDRFKHPVDCGVQDTGDFFAEVEVLDEQLTLRKASIALTGRLPTDEELELLEGASDDELDAAIMSMLEEPEFYDRLVEMYNDLFLTDRYLRNNDAVNLLDTEDHPNAYWYQELDPAEYSEDYINDAQSYTNRSVARAPLELVRYIVENDLPFTEIVTADYMMVNGYSAQTYGIDDIDFSNPADPTEFHPTQLPGIPHAGVLTSPMWLNRFPTTATNVNRHRSRMTYAFFLASDVMKLAERPVDPTSIVDFNPTLYNPNCAVCHANIDPVAGSFQNWDDQGRYRPPEGGWNSDMRPPGYKEETIPTAEWGNSLQWLGQRIASDPLFALSTVHTMHRGLTGQEPLTPPSGDMPEAEAKARSAAFAAQDADFQRIAAEFADSNFNLKVVVRELIKSHWFRAADLESAADDERLLEFDQLGTARFLPPELLHRKIEAVLGQAWVRNYDERPYLLTSSEFLIFYGGIDSDTVTQRITSPNGLMSSIAMRMANEMACNTVARDFTHPADERLLFPYVERTYVPEDINGFEVTGAVEGIKQNIQHLHRRILGEDLPLSSEEVERTYNLFLETWREGVAKRALDEVPRDMMYQCRATTDPYTGEDLPEEQRVSNDDNYAVRSWMAVVAYLLSDYRFLHE